MLSAAVRRTSRDVSIMKEKLIFSGEQARAVAALGLCTHIHSHTVCAGGELTAL